LILLLIPAGGFEDTRFAKEFVVGDKGDYWAKWGFYAGGMEPILTT
jgi:hypothetical protein